MSEPDLHRLVETGDAEGLRTALAAGADPLGLNALGEGLLARAAGEDQGAVLEVLLDHGVPPDHCGPAGNTALMVAAAGGHVELVERLLAAGASPDHANKWGFSARDWASWAQNGTEISARLREKIP